MGVLSLDGMARVIGDPARAAMLIALLAGPARTAGELAMIAGVSAPNASGHLQKLLRAELVSIEVQGRHRYYRLSTPSVANALESLAMLSRGLPLTEPESPTLSLISFCRTCYDHLAGKLATEIASSLIKQGLIEEEGREFVVTASGGKFFLGQGIDVSSFSPRRALARRCLDWTERKPHISGALGAALLRRLIELKWIAPIRGSRAMRLTTLGRDLLPKRFRLERLTIPYKNV